MAKTDLLRGLQRLMRLSYRASAVKASEAHTLEVFESGAVSRREFLRKTGAAAAVLLGGGVFQNALAGNNDEGVAILGAGIAGLTAAYRLQKAGVPWTLYEASPRWGGRIFTQRDFNAEGMFCELGGELVDTSHTDLMDLAKELGLELQALAPASEGVTRNIYYFKGKAYTDAQLLKAIRPLVAHVVADLKVIFGDSPRRMATYMDPGNSARWDKMTLREYLDSLKDVDRWVRDAVEIAYVTEYGLDADRQSALNLHMLLSTELGPGNFELFGVSDEAFRLTGGSGVLPDAVAQALGLSRSGTARYRPLHELVKISDAGDKLTLTFDTPQGRVTKRVARALCTLPFSTLRLVEGVADLELRPQKKAAIMGMGYGTNSKLMLGFTDKLWREGPGGRPKSNGGVFCDLPGQSYWETSRLQKGKRGIITNYTGGATGFNRWSTDAGATLDELNVLFPGVKARFDGSTSFMNWGRRRHSLGSYVCAGPGDYAAHFGSAPQTECGGRLLFAGEHTSIENGGYMNGGVETGNNAARALIAERSPKK